MTQVFQHRVCCIIDNDEGEGMMLNYIYKIVFVRQSLLCWELTRIENPEEHGIVVHFPLSSKLTSLFPSQFARCTFVWDFWYYDLAVIIVS